MRRNFTGSHAIQTSGDDLTFFNKGNRIGSVNSSTYTKIDFTIKDATNILKMRKTIED